jgi:hypothetical protein
MLVQKMYPREIAFRDLLAADTILIETQYSTYGFLVVDARDRRGVLWGSSLKNDLPNVVLVARATKTGKENRVDLSSLKTGSRAIFYVGNCASGWRLTTSVITGLDHIRCGARRRLS